MFLTKREEDVRPKLGFVSEVEELNELIVWCWLCQEKNETPLSEKQ